MLRSMKSHNLKHGANLYLQVCVTAAGRNDRSTKEFATVDWMAYQGAPDGGVAGKTRIAQWWTGSKCQEITLPSVSVYYYFCCVFCGEHLTFVVSWYDFQWKKSKQITNKT